VLPKNEDADPKAPETPKSITAVTIPADLPAPIDQALQDGQLKPNVETTVPESKKESILPNNGEASVEENKTPQSTPTAVKPSNPVTESSDVSLPSASFSLNNSNTALHLTYINNPNQERKNSTSLARHSQFLLQKQFFAYISQPKILLLASSWDWFTNSDFVSLGSLLSLFNKSNPQQKKGRLSARPLQSSLQENKVDQPINLNQNLAFTSSVLSTSSNNTPPIAPTLSAPVSQKQREITTSTFSDLYFEMLKTAMRNVDIIDARISKAFDGIAASTTSAAVASTAAVAAVAFTAATAKEDPKNLTGKWIIKNGTAQTSALIATNAFNHIKDVKVDVSDEWIYITTPDYRNENEVKSIYSILFNKQIPPENIQGYQRNLEASSELKFLEEKHEFINPVFLYNKNGPITKYGSLVKSIDKISSRWKSNTLTSDKNTILNDFLKFYHQSISTSDPHHLPENITIIRSWVDRYEKANRISPFKTLAEQRRTGCLSIFNPTNTDSIKFFENMISKEKHQELKSIIKGDDMRVNTIAFQYIGLKGG